MTTLDLHHLSFVRNKSGVVTTDDNGIPFVAGQKWRLLNDLLHSPQSKDRDHDLILLSKLKGIVQPLTKVDGRLKAISMIKNIEKTFEVPQDIKQEFRAYCRNRFEKFKFDYRWQDHILALHDQKVLSYGSDKVRPSFDFKKGRVEFVCTSKANQDQSLSLEFILQHKTFRDLFDKDREMFLVLTTGYYPKVGSIGSDMNAKAFMERLSIHDFPVGRCGLRYQEAEKIRTLFMPLEAFDSLTRPIVDLLELYVKYHGGPGSPSRLSKQTTFLDDYIASEVMRQAYFPFGRDADELIYSIDQTSFTDSFPWELQLILLEEMAKAYSIPQTCIDAMSAQVQGAYEPMEALLKLGQQLFNFGRGTPMGGYGLFMLATLSHQWLTEMLQQRIYNHNPLFIQGDDCTLQGTRLYEEYTSTMQRIGCEVNPSKTMVSIHAFEFCGFISTPEQGVPMYRPRLMDATNTESWLDKRCLQAFGTEYLSDYLMQLDQNLYDTAVISGYIPNVTEDPDLQFAQQFHELRMLLEGHISLSSDTQSRRIKLLNDARTRIMKNNIVFFDIDQERTNEIHHQRDTGDDTSLTYCEYQSIQRELRGLNHALLTDPSFTIEHYTERINYLSHLIDEYGQKWLTLDDQLKGLSNPKDDTDKNPYKKKDHTVANIKSARESLKRLTELTEKEDL
jgi:hypothetical protein